MCPVLALGITQGPTGAAQTTRMGLVGVHLCWEGRAGYELVALQLSLPPKSQSYLRVIPAGILLYAIYF